MTESEFVVVGMEPNVGGPPFALLAREEKDGLVYAGSAFVTLPQPARDQFWTRTEALKIKKPVVKAIARNRASFVRPTLRVRAKHLKGGDMPEARKPDGAHSVTQRLCRHDRLLRRGGPLDHG